MAAIMDYGGLLPLITLLQSQDTRIQEMALTAIGRVVLAGTFLIFVTPAPSPQTHVHARHASLVVPACLSYRPVEHQQAGSCVPGRVEGDDRAHDLVEPGRAAARAGHPQGPRQIR
jgi:hypothetical protein